MVGVLALLSCSSEDEITNLDEVTPSLEVNEVISPVSVIISPVQTPKPSTATPEVPMPRNDKGTVVGIIYNQTQETPFADRTIYLAKVTELKAPDGSPEGFMAELDVKNDPFDDTDESGRFVIENVEPGLYGIAVRLPSLQETLLYEADTNVNLSVQIEAGKISDMGILRILGPE
jgi:hypothetical protein